MLKLRWEDRWQRGHSRVPWAGAIIEKLKNFPEVGRVVFADGHHSVDRGERDQK